MPTQGWTWIAAAGALASIVISCAGGGVSVPKPKLLGSQSFTLAAGEGTAFGIDVQESGLLSATANWGPNGSDIDVYITDALCPGVEALVMGSCAVLGRGDGLLRPERAQARVTPGRYQAFVLALAENGDSGTVEFSITR